MCWNKEVSILSFTVGLFISLYVAKWAYDKKNYHLMALSLVWLYPLCMQLVDYMIWEHKCGEKVNKMGYMLNVTQPIVLYLVFMHFNNIPLVHKIISSLCIFIYIAWFLITSTSYDPLICPSTESGHIEYPWWDKEKLKEGLYLVTLSVVLLSLIKPFYLAKVVWLYVIITLLISYHFIYDGSASMWCWFAVCTPLIGQMACL